MKDKDTKILEEAYNTLYEDITNKIPILIKQYPKYTQDDIIAMTQFDPTGKIGKFIPWILRQSSRGNIIIPEDGGKVKNALTQFIQQVKAPDFNGDKDINAYKTLQELEDTVNINTGKTSKGAAHKQAIKQGIEEVSKTGIYSIYKITTPEGAAKLCRDTSWCVKDPKYATKYLQEGPLYMITKNNEQYVLFQFESKSIKTTDNAPIDKNIANEIEPLLHKFPEFENVKNKKITPKEYNKLINETLDHIDGVAELIADEPTEIFNYDLKRAKTITIYDLLVGYLEGITDFMIGDEAVGSGDFSIFNNNESLNINATTLAKAAATKYFSDR
jgi:hypothetical protein